MTFPFLKVTKFPNDVLFFHRISLHSVTHRMRPSPQKKRKIVYLNSGALSRGLWRTRWRTCHLMWRNLAIGFLDKINLFFSQFFIYVYMCFVGNVTVTVWLASVWLIISCDHSDWMMAISMNADRPLWLYGPYLYDYHLYYPAHQCVWLLTINSNQCECLAISVCISEYVREYVLHTK